MSKPKLIILSDIFDATEEAWMGMYRKQLSPFFEIVEYDSRQLAGILPCPQEEVHQRFVNAGIEDATQRLSLLEEKVYAVLGFSVGGTIAWRYALENPHCSSLYLISATGLRNETVRPTSAISLCYGEHESSGPNLAWFDTLGIAPKIFKNEFHECYKNEAVITQLCQTIIEDSNILG